MLPVGTFPYHAFQGLTLPLVVLGVLAWRQHLRNRALPLWPALAVAFLLIVPGTAYRVDNIRKAVAVGRQPHFLTDGEHDALTALSRDKRPGGVLTPVYMGLLVPAYTGRETWVGAGSWSPDFNARQQDTENLFDGRLSPAQAQALVQRSGARFLLSDCHGRADITRTVARLHRSSAALRLRDGVARAMSDRPRFPLFDSLRAIAALSIFGFHIAASQLALNDPDFPWLGQLNVGVPIFFVVSGFLLYRPFVARRAQGRPAPSMRGYAIRRALRIIPAYWVALTVIAVWLGLQSQVFSVDGIVTYYGFLQVYDVSTIDGGVGQAWTLGVEVTFYAFLPIWAWAMRRRLGELWPLIALAAFGIVWKIVVLATVFQSGNKNAFTGLVVLPAWMETFAAGMALAVLSVWRTDRDYHPRWLRAVEERPWLPWLVALLAFAAVGPHGWQGGPESQVMIEYELKTIVAVGLVMPAVFGDPTRGWVRRVLAFPPLLWVGLVSYGFFLWHLAVIDKLQDGGVDDTLGVPLFTLVALAASLGIAAVSWYVIERPSLRLARRLTGPTAQTRTLADDRAAAAAEAPPS